MEVATSLTNFESGCLPLQGTHETKHSFPKSFLPFEPLNQVTTVFDLCIMMFAALAEASVTIMQRCLPKTLPLLQHLFG